MKEVFLYGCEECGVVIAIEGNRGKTFYVNHCVGCANMGRWYERILIAHGSNGYKESQLYIEKKEENGDTNTGTDKKE
jgi:hypothetical protein